jgi:hypothetical protein
MFFRVHAAGSCITNISTQCGAGDPALVVEPGAGSEQEAHVADRYIDNREVVEYGRHFLAEVGKLIGLSVAVDIAALQQLVRVVVEAMEGALPVANQQQSGARTGRTGTSSAKADTVDKLRRFHYHLKTLPRGTAFDIEAFFIGGTSGGIHRLKPADVLARADHAVSGFSASTNAGLPGTTEWLPVLIDTRNALAAAIEGKRAARGNDKDAVGSVAEIRERFLNVYNNMAKRLVWAVLAEIGRLDDYTRYFLDLQVNEDGRRPVAEPEDPDTGTETPGAEPGGPAEPAAV